jgi:hypothetical protein
VVLPFMEFSHDHLFCLLLKCTVSFSTTVLSQATEHTKLQKYDFSFDALNSAFVWCHFAVTVRTPAATPI